jgi:hypothetical protein
MHPDRMRLAAEHLRLRAPCLFESCTVNGQWDGEHSDEQKDCEEMVALADELEHAAGCLPNQKKSGGRRADPRSGETP